VVGEQPLEVVLADGEDDAQQAADEAQQENQDAPCRRRVGQQREPATRP
jgi:hypothetical protein